MGRMTLTGCFDKMARHNLQWHLCAFALSLIVPIVAKAAAKDTPWKFRDIEGRTLRPFDDESVEAIVLVFIATDCPIANSYQPKLQRLAKQYAEAGIRMFLIHPRPDLSVDKARQHAKEYGIELPVVIDNKLKITRRVGATVTPQAFVFARGLPEAVYQGRIDNLYATFGKKRRTATTDELGDALQALAAGGQVEVQQTKSIGCIISGTKTAVKPAAD